MVSTFFEYPKIPAKNTKIPCKTPLFFKNWPFEKRFRGRQKEGNGRVRFFGPTVTAKIKDKLQPLGLHLGMDLMHMSDEEFTAIISRLQQTDRLSDDIVKNSDI